MNAHDSHESLSRFFAASEEWLLTDRAGGRSFPLRRSEIALIGARGNLYLEFIDEKGLGVWRVRSWKLEKEKVVFDLSGRFGRERRGVAFAPRVSAAQLGAEVDLARIEKAQRTARLLVSSLMRARLVRASLARENGRFAQIVFADAGGRQKAALADASDSVAPEIFLSTALLWLARLERRKKHPIGEIYLLAEKKRTSALRNLCALLRPEVKRKIKIFAVAENRFEEVAHVGAESLLKSKPRPIRAAEARDVSSLAKEITQLAPEAIDVVFSARGETVRFRGLPFLRVRRVFGRERAWFGVENRRRILTGGNFAELLDLIEELKTYRRHDSPNKRHEYYALAGESWLESVLRRDISRLDANLILSPLYNQFRVARERIDLLALRRDGRLVVVELKTSPDREMIFQAADYWREIERVRRSGLFEKQRAFGERRILDAPPLVYLVAPTLAFHRDFFFFAKKVSEAIELFRFEINENWRERVKVLRRREAGCKRFL